MATSAAEMDKRDSKGRFGPGNEAGRRAKGVVKKPRDLKPAQVRQQAREIAYRHPRRILKQISVVFYDTHTLYSELVTSVRSSQ